MIAHSYMKKYRNYLILVLVLAALAIPKFFCGGKKEGGMTGKGPGGKAPVKVSVYVARPEAVSDTYQVGGNLEANEQVVLYPEAQGLVRKIYFREGSMVKKGELLLKLNDADLQAQLKKALATRKLREENARRNQVLLSKEAVSKADADITQTELSSIDADIELLHEQIRKTELRAPFNGTIGLRNISEGALVTTQTAVTTLQDDAQLKISFAVPERYAMLLGPGDPVEYRISGNNNPFAAKIYARDAVVSDQTRTVRMKALCNADARKLIPGIFVNVSLKSKANQNSILIPTTSIVPVLKGQKVFVVHADSVIEVPVKTGFRTENRIQVTEGLNPGDSVVVDGVLFMKKGVKVKVAKAG